MSALARTSLASSVLYLLFAGFWIVFPFWHLLAGSYEGGVMLFTAFIFAGFFLFIAFLLFACYCYALRGPGGSIVRGLVWCFVVLTGLGGITFAGRILYLVILTPTP
ncbi:MAG: hypothetical protein K1X53_08845 [Candidatus Sumerlaeaceae bacterium]|nr:hypothetical protein [Candidatus Sumerlaeaceae bacterium]